MSEAQELPPRGRMTLIDHLTELRRRLVISLLAVAVGAVIVFVAFDAILEVLDGPYRDALATEENPDGRPLIITAPLEGFIVRLKVATYGGIVLAMPVLLWQLWRFITPGLYRHEKRYAVPFVASSIVLFLLGAALAWLTIPRALDFLLGIAGPEVEPLITANSYLSLVSLMLLAFGLAFEFPLVLVFLLIARVVSTDTLRHYRRHALVGISVFAAVITPSQDPYSLFLMIGPMYLFYEMSILVGRVMKR